MELYVKSLNSSTLLDLIGSPYFTVIGSSTFLILYLPGGNLLFVPLIKTGIIGASA